MDKSRQQFEGWFKKECNKKSYNEDTILLLYGALFEVWQASRESLEIELPQRKGICHNEYESGYFDGIDKCEDVLIRSGVKIKNG
ncbi:hypothetical protein [Providencia sp. PROV111]|uniref:hypothetical protein n=1 Tax=Providencia sp. PROV111 TaxID=2949822 RepID=UPI00234A4B0F|nr:hypothetical protein [Providencia sp. PROV111]